MFDFKQLQKLQKEMQEKMAAIQQELEQKTVEASSGGGVVTVTMNGNQQMVGIKIQKDAVDPDDIEMLEDLIMAAVNSALEKSKAMSQDKLSGLTGGLRFPGLPM